MGLREIHWCQWDSLQLHHDDLLAGPGQDVTGVALRAAVLLIWTANSIFQWAAAPLAREQPAAGGLFGTQVCAVTLHRRGLSLDIGGGWNLGVPWNHNFSFSTRGAALITLILLGTTVAPISTAHRLRQWAASPLFKHSHVAAGG